MNWILELAKAGDLWMLDKGDGKLAPAIEPWKLPRVILQQLPYRPGLTDDITHAIEDLAGRGRLKVVDDSRPDGGGEFRYAAC